MTAESAETIKTEKQLLLYNEALIRVHQAEELLHHHDPDGDLTIHWWEPSVSSVVSRNFVAATKNYPLAKVEFDNNEEATAWEKANKDNSILSLGSAVVGSVLFGVLLTVLGGVETAFYAPMVCVPLGIAGSVYYNSLFYDGVGENRLQRAIIKIFFGRKAKQKLEENKKDYSRYLELKEPFDVLVKLTRQELESENVFNIINEHLNAQGKHLILGEDGRFKEFELEEYEKVHPEILEQKHEKNKKDIMEQIELKFNRIKQQELLP